jgi:hypothetical protein
MRIPATVADMLDAPLPVELPEEQLDLVTTSLRNAGAIARRNYSEHDRWDLQAFAFLLYRLSWNHVEAALRDDGAKVWFDQNSLRFQLGAYTCSIYAGGHSVDWDVHKYEFTRSPKRVEALNVGQGQLFDPSQLDRDLDIDPTALQALTFVNCGDPQLGTAALYLGAPYSQRGRHLWAWVRRLYRADEDGAAPAQGPTAFPSYTDRSTPEVFVSRKSSMTATEVKLG